MNGYMQASNGTLGYYETEVAAVAAASHGAGAIQRRYDERQRQRKRHSVVQ